MRHEKREEEKEDAGRARKGKAKTIVLQTKYKSTWTLHYADQTRQHQATATSTNTKHTSKEGVNPTASEFVLVNTAAT